jgi:PEGA domain
MRRIYNVAMLVALLGLAAHSAQGQDTAEAAAATANSSTAASAVKLPTVTIPKAGSPGSSPVPLANPASPGSSPHLLARTGPPADEVNRKDFEDNAGDKAGKLFLRSVPSGAEIFVNDLLVGRTPLLMVIAPGKYKIDMRGPRQESGHSTAGVMPKETQTVVINLNQRYPASISVR